MVLVADAAIAIRGDMSGYNKDIDGAEAKTKSLGDKLKGAMTGAAIGAAVGGMASIGIAAATSVDKAFDAIRVGTGATGQALKDLEGDFKSVAGNVPDDIGLVGQVLADLNTRTGQTGEGLQDLTEQILDMSRITGTDATANVAAATRAFGDWDIAVQDQAGTLDMFFRASQSTGIGVDTLMAKVVQFGAPMRQMGFSLDETAALMGKFEKEGVNTELVMGSMRIALGKFAKAGREPKEALQETISAIQELGPGAESTALAMETFGARAGADMAAAILEGRFEIGALFDTVADGTETIATATEDTEEFSDKLKGFFNSATVALGEFAMPLAGLGNAIPGLTRILPMLGGGIGALAGSFGSTGKAGMALSKIAPLIGASFHAMLGPIGLVTGAIALLAAAFATDFLGIRTATEGFVDDQAMNFGEMGDAVHALASETGLSFQEMKDSIKQNMEETGRTFDESVYHLRKTKTDWGTEHQAMLDESESRWGEMQGIYSAGVEGVASAVSSKRPLMEQVSDDVLSDPLVIAMLGGKEEAERIAGETPGGIAQALLAGQFEVDDAATQLASVMEQALLPTVERANIIGFLSSQELANGLADGRPAVRAEAQRLRDEAEARLAELDGFGYGFNVGTSFADGMNAAYGYVVTAAGNLATATRNQIGINSEPEDRNSPLYGITKWGGNIVKTLAKGIYGELGTGSAAAGALAGALVPALGGPSLAGSFAGSGGGNVGGGVVKNFYLTVEGKEPVVSSAQEILREMQRLESFSG